MSSRLAVGVAGLGTVGCGVVRLLQENADVIALRAGRVVTVTAVSARERMRDRGVALEGVRWFEDPLALATDGAIDVVVEVIGGAEGVARALVETALGHGKPVVTANKALIAVHGAALAATAEQNRAALGFEAAVAGGIPVIKALREGLAGNRITRVAGILNGTCNYILSAMTEQRREFAETLAEAKRLGYAEADPTVDIDGIDAAHKLAILAALAFGRPVALQEVAVEGIRRVSQLDIAFAGELGYRIKLLGIAEQADGAISARVQPAMVPASMPLARVDGVTNAVVAEGDFVGRIVLEGAGAGAGPTASAIVADLIDLARGRLTPVWGQAAEALASQPRAPLLRQGACYYLRLMVVDRPGVIADVTAVLRDLGVSLESMLQRGRAPGETVPVVMVTHETAEAAIRTALTRIAALDAVLEEPVLIRIELT
ncbi:MAG: homoserine dehydrogenase [Acetobacteraceae bacterium]